MMGFWKPDRWGAMLFPGLLALFLGAPGSAQVKSDKTIKVAVNLVLVNATVDGPDGRAVTDLKAEDFTVTEDTTEQELAIFRPTTSPFHLALLIDVSASTVSKIELLRAAAIRFFDQLSPDDQIAVVEVGDSAKLVEGFTSDRARLAAAVKRVGNTPSSTTRLYDSIIYALDDLLKDVKDRKALVILTDACDNGSQANYHRMNVSVYKNDAVIYALLVDTADDQLRVLQDNLEWASCVSLVLCADTRVSEPLIKRVAHRLVERLPKSCRVSLYQNQYRRKLINILPCELSREKINLAIEESKPFCDSVLRFRERSPTPDSQYLSVAIVDSLDAAQDRFPVELQKTIPVLLVKNLSDVEIDHEISKVVRAIPANADEVGQDLPGVYRVLRDILVRASQSTGGSSFNLAALEQADEYYTQVARELRTIYSLGYYSKDPSPLFRSVRVKVRQPGYAVKARRAYLPK